jgi:mRNA-degrading endonuclease RelE of RelBE toxin-antitoxin system
LKTYEVLLNPKAVDELKKLPLEAAERIKEGLNRLRENPTKARSGVDVKHIAGTSGPKLYRLRVGGYRAIFWVDEKRGEVLVEKVAPRKKAYVGISYQH